MMKSNAGTIFDIIQLRQSIKSDIYTATDWSMHSFCACNKHQIQSMQMDIFIACKLAIIEHSKSKHVSIMMAHASQKERICKIRTLNQRNPQLALLLQSSDQRVCEHDTLSSMHSNHQPHLVSSVYNTQHLKLYQRMWGAIYKQQHASASASASTSACIGIGIGIGISMHRHRH